MTATHRRRDLLSRIEEEQPGAAAEADLLLRTSRRPWCPDMF